MKDFGREVNYAITRYLNHTQSSAASEPCGNKMLPTWIKWANPPLH